MKKINDEKAIQVDLKGIPGFKKNISPALELGVSIEEFDKRSKEKTEKKLIIFDFDETLFKTKKVWDVVNAEVLRELNLPISPERFDYIANNAFHVFNNEDLGIFKNMEEQKKYFANQFDKKAMEVWARPEFIESVEIYGEWEKIIKELYYSGYTLAISSSRDLMTIETVLKNFGLYKYFDKDLILAAQGGKNWEDKPSSHMVDYILQETGIKPQNTIMVGDSHLDIKMAKQANVKSLGIGYGGYTSFERIQKENPDYIIKTEKNINNFPFIVEGLLNKNTSFSTLYQKFQNQYQNQR